MIADASLGNTWPLGDRFRTHTHKVGENVEFPITVVRWRHLVMNLDSRVSCFHSGSEPLRNLADAGGAATCLTALTVAVSTPLRFTR